MHFHPDMPSCPKKNLELAVFHNSVHTTGQEQKIPCSENGHILNTSRKGVSCHHPSWKVSNRVNILTTNYTYTPEIYHGT